MYKWIYCIHKAFSVRLKLMGKCSCDFLNFCLEKQQLIFFAHAYVTLEQMLYEYIVFGFISNRVNSFVVLKDEPCSL